MRNTAVKVGIFLSLCFLTTINVHATAGTDTVLNENTKHYFSEKLVAVAESTPKVAQEAKPAKDVKEVKTEPVAPSPVEYTVATGDSLTKIADAYQTQWQRLFAKNTQIADPNIISAGQVITIPAADEQVAERAVPEPVAVMPAPASRATSRSVAIPQVRGSSAGNTYSPGYCTWYAKNRRPDLPNRLGNAGSWVASAATQGFATGSAPQAGAIGQQGNHVVYVESVNGDGTVTISEMNYQGLYVVSSRTVAASSFRYIY